MEKGTVKFFNETKGFGFIKPNDGSDELFVHVTGLSGVKTLSMGDSVEYEVVETKKGLQAKNVRPA